MERMEQSDSPPTARLYNEILRHFAQMGSALAAQRVETIVAHMHDLATKNPRLKPDVYSYNILISGWARSNDSPTIVTERVWTILKQMKVHSVAPDQVTYNHAISLLAKSRRRRDVVRAEVLLQRLIVESNSIHNNKKLQPNILHYFNVSSGWVRLGHLQDATRVIMMRQDSRSAAAASESDVGDIHHHQQQTPASLLRLGHVGVDPSR